MRDALSNLWLLIRHGYWGWHWWPDSAWGAHLFWYDGPHFGIRAWRVSIYASPAPLDKSRDADSAPEERK